MVEPGDFSLRATRTRSGACLVLGGVLMCGVCASSGDVFQGIDKDAERRESTGDVNEHEDEVDRAHRFLAFKCYVAEYNRLLKAARNSAFLPVWAQDGDAGRGRGYQGDGDRRRNSDAVYLEAGEGTSPGGQNRDAPPQVTPKARRCAPAAACAMSPEGAASQPGRAASNQAQPQTACCAADATEALRRQCRSLEAGEYSRPTDPRNRVSPGRSRAPEV